MASLQEEHNQARIKALLAYLEASEWKLIRLMAEHGHWQGDLPDSPAGNGELELALVPYLVNHPPDSLLKFLEDNPTFRLPTRLDEANVRTLVSIPRDTPMVGPAGEILGTGMYEALDPDWTYSVTNYLYSINNPGGIAPFNSPDDIVPIPLKGRKKDRVTLALVGDWGTGPYSDDPSGQVMRQIIDLQPDAIVHLGDVYYSGTNGTYVPPNEEQEKLLDRWPTPQQQPSGTSFTLNSNHEMYSGAKGLYNVALKDSRFAAQRQTTYFALQYGDLTLVGLDSAYFSKARLVSVGSIGEPTDPQPCWLRGLNLDPARTIILTHHNPIEFDGSVVKSFEGKELYSQVTQALGGEPLAWYWGHVHIGIVYSSPWVNGSKTLGRCLGHGALPYGKATALPTRWVDFFTATPNPQAGPPRVYNGFVLLTIHCDGQVTEEYYEQHTNRVVFSNSY